MGWFFLMVAAALAIAVGIVWWTLPRKPKDAPGDGNAGERRDEKPRR